MSETPTRPRVCCPEYELSDIIQEYADGYEPLPGQWTKRELDLINRVDMAIQLARIANAEVKPEQSARYLRAAAMYLAGVLPEHVRIVFNDPAF